jgi:hypothetical protein
MITTCAGPNAIDLWRLCQIAEVLDVSLDGLVGRSNVMDRDGDAGA